MIQLCSWGHQVMDRLKSKANLAVFISHIREAYRQGYQGILGHSIAYQAMGY